MENRVTTFQLQWINYGFTDENEVVKEEIAILRRNHLLSICSYNGHNKLVESERIKTGKEQTDKFFDFLKEIRNDLKDDCELGVCNGPRWTIRIWDSTKKVQKLQGTTDYPPHGKEIEKYITDFIENDKGYSKPIMFGCVD